MRELSEQNAEISAKNTINEIEKVWLKKFMNGIYFEKNGISPRWV
jgi:hypothetical protein